MREMVQRKMKQTASEWMEETRHHSSIKNEQEQSLLEVIKYTPVDPLPDFHEYFFRCCDDEFSKFNKYTKQYLFLLLYVYLEAWESQGLCQWTSFRLELTAAGQKRFSGN